MIYLNTSQDGACEEGRLGFLLEKGEIFYSSKLSFNLLIFMTSCNNLITCTVSSPLTFPTHWTSHLRFKADLKLWTGSRPRASISRSMNSTCRVSCYFLCVCLYVLSFNLIQSLWVYTRLADPVAYDLFACVCICILEHGCVYVCLFFHLIRLLWVSTRLADTVALDTLVDLPRLTHLTDQRWDLPLLSTSTTSWLSYSTYLYLDFQFCSVTILKEHSAGKSATVV